ncbi:hypothetical protein QTP70_005928 [Hemibagrus guttatus]|uniref:Transposase n=1 Tax=Hemibagrus guttatus TaxID=175788 RepID=A0AAE0R0D5_9TELE|nr:hypothetical protein QTP70_005928 [Hemibagrus guttatus]
MRHHQASTRRAGHTKPEKKPFISENQRRARLKFAKDLRKWTVVDWSKVIFSDESNFQLCLTPRRVMVRWRPGEAYNPQCLAPTVKYEGGSVMIWGSFNKAGIGQICLCEGRMNQAKYRVVLEEHLLPSVPQLRGLDFPTGQCAMPYSQSNQSLDGGSPDQDPVMAGPISRFEPY